MRLRISLGALVLFLTVTGCGWIHEAIRPGSLEVVDPAPSGLSAVVGIEEFKSRLESQPGRAVVLPFADYSSYDSPWKHVDCHGKLHKALEEELKAAGIQDVIAGNEVASYLIANQVILEAAPILEKESPRTSLALRELNGEWSAPMRENIGRSIHQNLIGIQSLGAEVVTTPMDNRVLKGIAERFSADYIVRGRFTVYQAGKEIDTFPHPEYALAFYFPEPEQKIPFIGIANLRAYEFFGDKPVLPPMESIRSEDNKPSKTSVQKHAPILRLDLFIQDAKTGDILFVGASEVRSAELLTVTRHGYSQGYELAGKAIPLGADRVLEPLM